MPNLFVSSAEPQKTKFKAGEVIIGLSGVSIQDFHKTVVNLGAVVKREIPQLNAISVKVPAGTEDAFIQSAKSLPGVAFAEKNGIYEVQFTPNDPSYGSQYNMPIIKADKAWDTSQGSSEVKVAILDTGINYNHPDLAANYLAGGFDWVNNDWDPNDDHSHGTHCAGIVAAVINNGVGVAGVAQVKLWAEKVLNSGGSGGWDDVASGIVHAADCGVNIISMSLSGTSYSSLLENAVNYAYGKNVLLVAAAGNDYQNIDTYPHYPASYANVIAVSATNSADNFDSSYSDYGNKIEVSAPGTSVYSTVLGTSYGYKTGTSMACPHVAGFLGLIWSYKPLMTNAQVRTLLHSAVDDKGAAGKDMYYGYGRINCQKAISSPETYQYKFTLSPFIDKVYVNVTSQPTGILINGKANVSATSAGYPAPVLGWGSGNNFYMTFDYRTMGSGYELGFLVGTISTASGSLYRTMDGKTWVGPTAVSLVPFTTETDSGPCAADSVEPSAIQYVEGYNTGGTPSTSYFTGGWYGLRYVPSSSYALKKVEFMTGEKTGPFIVQLRPDNGSGYPSDTVYRQVTFTMSSTLGWQGAEFPTSYQVTAGTTYWIVFQPVAMARFSGAVSGTAYTYTWDDLGTGTGWDAKTTLPWMARFYRDVQPYFQYHFNVNPFADKAYVNVTSVSGGLLIYGLANVTSNSLTYPAPILGFAAGTTFYMPFDYRTVTGSSSFDLGFLVGSVSTATGNLYRTADGVTWTGPTAISLVPFTGTAEFKGIPASAK